MQPDMAGIGFLPDRRISRAVRSCFILCTRSQFGFALLGLGMFVAYYLGRLPKPFFALCGLFLVSGVIVVRWGIRTGLARLRLLQRGILTSGTLVETADFDRTDASVKTGVLEYHSVDGSTHRISVSTECPPPEWWDFDYATNPYWKDDATDLLDMPVVGTLLRALSTADESAEIREAEERKRAILSGSVQLPNPTTGILYDVKNPDVLMIPEIHHPDLQILDHSVLGVSLRQAIYPFIIPALALAAMVRLLIQAVNL